jgi:nucleoid DNA-binding protein
VAKRIQAIAAYRPRIDLGESVTEEELSTYIARGTALNAGEIQNVLKELNEALIFFARRGSPVKISGLGTFLPTLKTNGRFKLGLRLDRKLHHGINAEGASCTIINQPNIGMTQADMIARWDGEHPDDPIAD